MTSENEISFYYKIPRISLLFENDIKVLKKINLYCTKYKKTKDFIILFNYFKTLDNLFFIKKLKPIILEFCEDENKLLIEYIINNFEEINESIKNFKFDFNTIID